jgi:hypothetical protein
MQNVTVKIVFWEVMPYSLADHLNVSEKLVAYMFTI